jgi:hypothetical protein
MSISVIELPGDCEGDGSCKQEAEGDERDHKLLLSFTEARTAYEAVAFFFYVRRISRRGRQNFLNLELTSFFVKHKVSTKQ